MQPRRWRLVATLVLGAAAGAGLGIGGLTVTAGPAAAHTVGGVDATDYATTIRSVAPPVPGLRVRVIDTGDRLELTNRGPAVTVLGYDGEPYLRVGPAGVFENVRSPARYLNRSRLDPEAPPPWADPTADPRWRRVGPGPTVRWHDHRAHWMGADDPPVVQRDPDRAHLIQRFRIDLVRAGETIRVRGDVRYVPGPAPWPWIGAAGVLALAVVGGAWTRRAAAALAGGLAVAVAGTVAHAVGAWADATAPLPERGANALPTVGAVALAAVALVQLRRRGARGSAPLVVMAGLFVAIAIGLADVSALSHSQLPTTLPDALDRAAVALALGGGFGAALGAARFVRHRTGPDSTPPGATGADALPMLQR
jgi:hypothetical protein